MSARPFTPNRARDVVYGARMQLWFQTHPQQFREVVDNGIRRIELELKFEAWQEARAREAAMRRHPASGVQRFGPPPKAAPTPECVRRSILRDVATLLRKAVRR